MLISTVCYQLLIKTKHKVQLMAQDERLEAHQSDYKKSRGENECTVFYSNLSCRCCDLFYWEETDLLVVLEEQSGDHLTQWRLRYVSQDKLSRAKNVD